MIVVKAAPNLYKFPNSKWWRLEFEWPVIENMYIWILVSETASAIGIRFTSLMKGKYLSRDYHMLIGEIISLSIQMRVTGGMPIEEIHFISSRKQFKEIDSWLNE